MSKTSVSLWNCLYRYIKVTQLVTSFREPTCLGVMGGLMKRKVLLDGEVPEAVKWLKSLVLEL